MDSDDRWHCPLCGHIAIDWKDGLDHIVKEHLKEYTLKFYSDKAACKKWPNTSF